MARVSLTYRDYEALPGDGRRYEIHEGELSVTAAPSPKHQTVALNLAVALDAHVKANRLGQVFIAPIDVILNDSTIVQPDILFLGQDRLRLISQRGIEGAPTLVEGRYVLRARAAGDAVLRVEPLADLALALGSIWPDRAES